MPEDKSDIIAILDLLGCHDVQTIHLLQGGSDTAVWRVVTPQAQYALRMFPPGYGEVCKREAAAMVQATAYGVPTPTVHATAIWQEQPAMLLTWMPGHTIAAALQRQPWRARRLGYLFGRTQAAIHAIPAPPLLCDSPDSWLDWGSPHPPALQERLQQLSRQQDALLHLDYHPLNVLTDGSRITGVIDWTNAQAGDPRADAARTETILRLDSTKATDRGFMLAAKRMLIGRFLQGWRQGYSTISPALPEMALFYAWAGSMMEIDLAGKRTSAELEPVRRWTTQWMEKLHISP